MRGKQGQGRNHPYRHGSSGSSQHGTPANDWWPTLWAAFCFAMPGFSFSFPTDASTKTAAAAAAAAATAIALTAALWQKRSRNRVRLAKRKEGYEKIKLLPFESSFLCKQLEGISTMTFFEAESMEDVEEARSFFQARALAIVDANPWLLGFIHVDERDKEGNLALFVPPKTKISQRERSPFSIFETPEPIPDDFHFMVQALQPAMLGDTFSHMASVSLDNNTPSWDPLWKVTFIPNVDGGKGSKPYRFGLVVSGSHVLLDGHGYYKIFNMLSSNEPIAAFSPARNRDLQPAIDAVFTEPSMMTDPPPGWTLRVFASKICSLFFPVPTKIIGFVVSKDWIRDQKEAYQKSIAGAAASAAAPSPLPPFVSTNDVIVSEFFKATGAFLGSMAINLRGRVDDCTDELFGNYEDGLSYTPKDYASPSSIRQSITGPVYQRPGAALGNDPLPTNWDHLSGGGYALTTSWASFAKGIAVGRATNTKQSLHVPLNEMPWLFTVSFVTLMTIFQPRDGETAILCCGKEELCEKLAASEMMGSLLYSGWG